MAHGKGGAHGNGPSWKKHFRLQRDPELISCKFSLQKKPFLLAVFLVTYSF
jgi:hypothetical protein